MLRNFIVKVEFENGENKYVDIEANSEEEALEKAKRVKVRIAFKQPQQRSETN